MSQDVVLEVRRRGQSVKVRWGVLRIGWSRTRVQTKRLTGGLKGSLGLRLDAVSGYKRGLLLMYFGACGQKIIIINNRLDRSVGAG